MRINDIEYLSKSNTKKSFNDTISAYFTKQEIWATKSIDISNNDGIHSHFDFAIQNNDGERLVKTAARPNDINQAKIFNYDVNAVSPVRTAKFFLLINDQQNAIDDAIAPAALASLNRSKTKVIGYREILEDNKYLVNK